MSLVSMKSNSLAITRPEIAKQWHPTKNGNLTPSDVTFGSEKKVWWQCPISEDHEWETRVADRKNGYGCPCCVGRKIVPSNCLATTHPEIAAQWHPTKNGDLAPSDVTFGSNRKIWWKCLVSQDHEWKAPVSSRTTGRGCSCCVGRKAVLSNCLATTHPEIAKQWHPTKNGNLTPNDVTLGSIKKIWWQCLVSQDHEWAAMVCDRTKGRGCSCCRGFKVVTSNCLATTHPEIAKQWHPTKNGNLTPNDVTYGSREKVWWQCPISQDHEWKAIVKSRTTGCGCPICNELKGEKAIREYLTKNKILFKSQFIFKNSSISKSKFDFCTKKVVIEYQGEQHYYPVSFKSKKGDISDLFKNLKRDFKKKQFCEKHNIPLLEIPYWDKDRIPEILNAFFAGEEVQFSEPPEIVVKYKPIRDKILQRFLSIGY